MSFNVSFHYHLFSPLFRPAEWRWKLPQVCDNEWHHYAVSVNFPTAELTVDGDR